MWRFESWPSQLFLLVSPSPSSSHDSHQDVHLYLPVNILAPPWYMRIVFKEICHVFLNVNCWPFHGTDMVKLKLVHHNCDDIEPRNIGSKPSYRYPQKFGFWSPYV